MAAPRVSVIIIVFNGAAFLAEAVDSALAQSFTDLEVLIVDDGSSDQSRDIAMRYAGKFPDRVRALAHADGANHGMSATRNRGLSEARGEFIAFLDADDVWAPEKLAQQVAILDAAPDLGLVYGRALIWHSWRGEGAPADFFYDLGVAADAAYPPPQLFRVHLKNMHQTPTTSGTLLRRSLVDAVGGFEAGFRAMFEDQVFFAKALLAAPAHVAGEVWFKYRQHGQSASALSAATGGDRAAQLRYLRWLEDYLTAQGTPASERAAVRAAANDLRWAPARALCNRGLRALRKRWRRFRS